MTSIHRSRILTAMAMLCMLALAACVPGAPQTSKPSANTLEPKTLRDSITGPGFLHRKSK